MAKESACQKKTMSRVMHEFAHGELKSGKHGHGGNVKRRKQAIAIALLEAGGSSRVNAAKNKRNRAKTTAKECAGTTAKQRNEGHA